jgi:ribosomal biogenesis protein LAS1
LVSLLVKQGLLVHDLNPSCSSPAPSDESIDEQSNSDFDEAPDSPSSSDGLGTTMRQEDLSVAAWKHTCVQLAEHMPQLPALLLSSIFGTLTAMSSESNSKMEPKEDSGIPFSKEELVEWATWILDQSSALSKKKKAQTGLPKFIETGANMQMQAVFPQDTLKELALMCMRSRLDKESLVKLISRLSPLIGCSSFRRRVELLARCTLSSSNEGYVKDPEVDLEIEESGRNFVVLQRESERYAQTIPSS